MGLNWNTTVLGLARIRSPWRSRPDNRGWVPFSDEHNDRQTDRYGQTVTDRQRTRWMDVGREKDKIHKKGSTENGSLGLCLQIIPLGAINNLVTV